MINFLFKKFIRDWENVRNPKVRDSYGKLAGVVGIASTILLCFPISWIARYFTDIASLTAQLPWYGYLLILLSVGLTTIAGLFPSSMAAKKDPVIALRSE